MPKDIEEIDFSQEKTKPIPIPYLKFIFRVCPRAGELFCFLWEAQNENGQITVDKNDIPSTTLLHRHAFNSSLRMLVREGLISVEEGPTQITIELVGWNDGVF